MTNQELRRYVSKNWGNNVLTAIDNQHIIPMTVNDFMNQCTPCDSNYTKMFLTGIQKLYPEVYNAIPENKGRHAWTSTCTTLALLGVEF